MISYDNIVTLITWTSAVEVSLPCIANERENPPPFLDENEAKFKTRIICKTGTINKEGNYIVNKRYINWRTCFLNYIKKIDLTEYDKQVGRNKDTNGEPLYPENIFTFFRERCITEGLNKTFSLPIQQSIRSARALLIPSVEFSPMIGHVYTEHSDKESQRLKLIFPKFIGGGDLTAFENNLVQTTDTILTQYRNELFIQDEFTLKERIICGLITSFPVFLDYTNFEFDTTLVNNLLLDRQIPGVLELDIIRFCDYLCRRYPINSICVEC